MNKRTVPHRVVCKSLLVCDEDEKRKKNPVQTPRQAVETQKSVVNINSATSVHLTNGSDAKSIASEKHEEPPLEVKESDLSNRQRILHQASSNLNNLREVSSKITVSDSKPVIPEDDAEQNPVGNARHAHSSSKLDGKHRKPPPIEKTNSSAKQVSSNDSLPAKPVVKKYDKKETRDYIRKKKLQRHEKEQQELVQRKLELELRRQKLMELRDTTLKVLKASIKKKNQPKTEVKARNWKDVDDDDDDDHLEAPLLSLNTHSDMRNVNGLSKHEIALNSSSMHNSNFPSKSSQQYAEESIRVHNLTNKSSESILAKYHSSYSNLEKITSYSHEMVRETSSMPTNLAITRKTQPQNHLQPIDEMDDKKEFIRRLSDEVNRLSSSIKFLKENASKTLLETNKVSSKSVDGFHRPDNGNKKLEVSKSCQSIPHEMVNAVSELKDTLTLLSRTNLKPGTMNDYQAPVSMPPPLLTSIERTHTGGFSSSHPEQIPTNGKKEEKLQSVYQRHPKRLNHQGPRNYEDKHGASNEESDRSGSSGFIFESNCGSVKDTDSEEFSVQWLKSLALKPNPMNFITTLKSKLNLKNQKGRVISSNGKDLMMEKMFDAFNKKFKENLEKSLSSEYDGTRTELNSPAITCEPLDRSDLHLKLPTKLANLESNRKPTEYFPPKIDRLETGGGTKSSNPTAAPPVSKPRAIRPKDKRQKSFEDSSSTANEPVTSSQKPECVFLPLSIAHFPSADELKQSGTSSTRSSSTQPLSNMDKPLIIPKLHLKSGLASSTDLSTFHSKSNSEVSTQSKDTLPVGKIKMPIRLRQVTAADKSSLSSMSDLSESTVAIENKENESPKAEKDGRKIFNPSVLRLQAEAELNQIDLYNESLQQLVEAEHYRDITLAKEVAGDLTPKKDSRSSSHSKTRKKSRSASTTPSLTEITDTSTIMSELMLIPTSELNRTSFNFKFSPDQTLTKQSMQMLEQLLKDEEFWANHQKESLKLREKALLNSIRVGIVWFEVQKKQLKDSGQDHLIKNLKKKQRGLLLKLQQEKEEIARLQKTISSASEERRQILLQQYQLVKSQISAKEALKRKKPDSPASNNVNASKFFIKKPAEPSNYKPTSADIVCDKNLGQTLLEGLRALEQEKCKISEREKQLIEHSKNVDELLQWKKKFKDLEKQAGSSRPLRDRSTSPFRMTPEPTNGISAPTMADTDACQSKKSEEDPQGDQCGDVHNAHLSSKGNTETSGVRSSDHYGSESVESPESSETPRGHQSLCNSDISNAMKNISAHTKQTSIHIKTPLSPRLQNNRRLRYSSGSDDSMIFSQNETLSEQSETEVRVSALHEQLKQRKLEAERLQREHKRAQRERLKMKEQALIKQIQAYDEYIQKTRRELEQELSQAITPVVRPQIKQPRVAEKTVFKRQDSVPPSNLSDSSDVTPRKACSNEGQKILEKFFEQEESHSLEVPETDQIETFGKEEKDEGTAEVDFSAQVQEQEHENEGDTTIKFDEPELDQTLVVQDVQGLDQRSEGDEFPQVKAPAKINEPASLEVIPMSFSAQKSNQASSKSNSEVELHEELKSCSAQSSIIVSEVIKNSTVEKSESVAGSEIPDSVSEMPSLPTAQDSDRISAKLMDNASNVKEQGDTSIRDKASLSSEDIPASVQSVVEPSDKVSSVSSISSHLVGLPESPGKSVQEEILPERTEAEVQVRFQRLDDNSSEQLQSEKSVPEICSNSNGTESKDSLIQENIPSDEVKAENSIFKPVAEFSSGIIIAGEAWMDADDFFEANFPSTNKALKSSETCLLSSSPIDETQFKESNPALSGVDLKTKPDCPDPVLEVIHPCPEVSQKVLSSHESESDNEDASSKCDSVSSKISESSVKFSESGKSYEKDRSLSEVIEHCEISKILDSSSTSNESCKTFEHDFEEAKGSNDLFPNLSVVNEPSNEQELVSPCPSDVTDLITDAILTNLLQDSFDCIPPARSTTSEAEETASTMETPFIEALKRDHEALKVKSKGQNKEEMWEMEVERDRLYSAISVAEMILGVCLNDATETVLNIRKKVQDSSQKDFAADSSIDAKECSPEPENDSSAPPTTEAAPEVVGSAIVKEQNGVGLGDDVDFNQDWLIDEACVVREAEKLRLKQLQIEQEIERLQQAQQQAQQQTQQAPYIYERYLREIPNKPPPPYTPPVQPESVPTDENIVLNIVTAAAAHIYDSRLIHVEPKPPPNFTSDKNNSLAIYKKFLYDLCLQLINDIYADDQNETAEPWEKTVKRRAKTKVPTNKAMLIEEIKQKVSFLFGFRKKVAKENLIIRWSRKKRDHVDELLVREAQEEELEWTNYEYDEITVKNQVTMAILNNLLSNTATALSKALQKKLQKLEQSEK